MHPSLSRFLASATLALTFLLASAPARAADPVGPPIGNNKYRGTISIAGDQDEFTGAFYRGDTLTVVVTAPKLGKVPPTLKPVLSLVDPDGIVRTAGIVPSANGLSLQLKSFSVDKAGIWAVRVEGAEGSTGDFLVSFKVKPVAKQVFKKQRLGDELPFARNYDFPGFEGAVLDASVVYSARSNPVDFRSLTDPKGAEVLASSGQPAVKAATTKGTRVVLKGVVLSRGAGTYRMRMAIPTGNASFDMQLVLRAPVRPSSKKTLTLDTAEPTLDPVDVPFAADPGDTIHLTGTNFSTKSAPTVLFGDSRSPTVTVGDGGTSLTVVVPPRTRDSVVAVYVINPDGQGAARDQYFAYVPAPAISDLTDATLGTQVRTSPAAGGRQVRLLGTNFDATQTIRIGGVEVTAPKLISTTEFRFKLPALDDGVQTLTVTDVFRRQATSAFSVRYKTPPSFDARPYTPGAIKLNTAMIVTITGTGFESADQLFFAGQAIGSTFIDGSTRSFSLPGLAAGDYAVRLVDSIATAVDGPVLTVKPPPTITSVTVVAGPLLGTNEIPLLGGNTVRVDGTDFAVSDTVTFGGAELTQFVTQTSTRLEFVTPPAASGFASLSILDGADQSASAANVVRYVGFLDTTSSRMPAPASDDDFSAFSGAAADLDMDGRVDDVVLVSPIGSSIGNRVELTRVLLGDSSGVLTDQTSGAIPAAGSDSTGTDAWGATCLAIGDLDGNKGPEILIGGDISQNYGAYYNQVRLLQNNGSGGFSLDEKHAPASRYVSYVNGTYYQYYSNYYYTVFGSSRQQGRPQAIALGDLDKDGDLDAVVGTDQSQGRYVYMDPRYVDFSTTPATINSRYFTFYRQYLPATRILTNRISKGGGLEDVSLTSLPSAGNSNNQKTPPAALHCRDLAVADVNADGFLDIVLTWDDPTTVSAFGLSSFLGGGKSSDTARVATRVLLNTAKTPGLFTDVTATWLPAGATPEFWQANHLALGDLDGDGDADLVLVTSGGIDLWTGTETNTQRALRILRNDGTKFTDVTATAVPAADKGTKDDWRGDTVAIRDVNGDGRADVLVSTTGKIVDTNGAQSRRLRVFFGTSATAISLARAPQFLESPATDTGEASRLLFVGDLGGAGKPVLLLLGAPSPAVSPDGAASRAQEWKR